MKEVLTIEALGAQGDGIAGHGEETVFVPFALPGEKVLVDLGEKGRGRLLEVAEASPQRQAPPCAHFGTCGGCALQHMDEQSYGTFKRQQLQLTLARAGVEAEFLPSWQALSGSRRRASFGFARERGRFHLAFQEKGTINPVPLNMCAVLHPRIVSAFESLAGFGRFAHQHHKTRLVVTLCDHGLDVTLNQVKPLDGRQERTAVSYAASLPELARFSVNGDALFSMRPASHRMGPADVVPPPGGFLQAVKAAESVMTGFAVARLKGAGRIADLFAGCGAFTFPLAEIASVDAYESEKPALAALEAAVRSARGIRTVGTQVRDLFKEPLSGKRLRHYDAVVLDPPRAGARAQVEALVADPVERIVMASCNPASFARDADALIRGGYRMEAIQPIDQFLFSPHLELITAFSR